MRVRVLVKQVRRKYVLHAVCVCYVYVCIRSYICACYVHMRHMLYVIDVRVNKHRVLYPIIIGAGDREVFASV